MQILTNPDKQTDSFAYSDLEHQLPEFDFKIYDKNNNFIGDVETDRLQFINNYKLNHSCKRNKKINYSGHWHDKQIKGPESEYLNENLPNWNYLLSFLCTLVGDWNKEINDRQDQHQSKEIFKADLPFEVK